MPYLGLLFAVHISLLLYRSTATARAVFTSSFPVFFATVVLVWANLLHTSHVASLVGLLDIPLAYFGISMGVSLVYDWFFRMVCPEPAPDDGITLSGVWAQLRQSIFAITGLAVLGVVAVCVFLLATAVLANNWDTLAYRFPRVLFYLNGTGLMHPGLELDPRLLYYPYNGSLLYLFLAQYQLTGVSWNFVSVAAWIISGVAAFYVPLSLGGSVRAAIFSAYALMTTPIVLCLATSTNDEIISSMPMLLTMIFTAFWVRYKATAGFVFALFAVSIGAGTKLHWGFYAPVALVAVALGLKYYTDHFKDVWKQTMRANVLPLTFLLATPFAVSFLITNYISAGRFTNSEFNQQVLNSPFRFGVALQNVKIFTLQMLIAPLPDHVRVLGIEKENEAVNSINDWTGKNIFAGVQQGPPYTSEYYRFRGVVDPDASAQYEQTVWLGLAPLMIFLVPLFMLTRRREYNFYTWFLVLSFPCWHIAFCCMTKYVECVGTYYAYAAPIGIAPLGYVWERFGASENGWFRRLSKFLPLLLISNTLLAALLLFGSTKRDVTQAFRFTDGETGPSQTDGRLRPIIAKAKNIHIARTHWELLMWNLMRLNPAATYFSGAVPAKTKMDLLLVPLSTAYAWDSPAPIRGGKLGELKLAGTMASGSDAVFCYGPVCQTECPTCEDFFLLPLKSAKNGGNMYLTIQGPSAGLNPAQLGFVKFTYFNATTLASGASEWIALPDLATFKMSVPDQAFDHLQVEVSCEAGPGCPLAKTTLALRPGVQYLLQKMPEVSAGVSIDKIAEVFGPGWEGTEGSGYWKFKWTWRAGTDKMDASWLGGGGEKINDEMTVTTLTDKEVKILRSTTNSHFVGKWLPGQVPAAKGYAVWDPKDIWEGHRVGAGKK